MTFNDLTAGERLLLNTLNWVPFRMTVAELDERTELGARAIKSSLKRLRRDLLVAELPPRGAAPPIYGLTVFARRMLREHAEVKTA